MQMTQWDDEAIDGCNVPAYRSSPHHGKLAQGGPRDDGFRSGMSVLSTYASESPAEWNGVRADDDLSWWS